MTRPIWQIAEEVYRDWPRPAFYAAPYLSAMLDLDTLSDMYGADSASSVVAYFLCNAGSWKGEVARRVKAELKAMLEEARDA